MDSFSRRRPPKFAEPIDFNKINLNYLFEPIGSTTHGGLYSSNLTHTFNGINGNPFNTKGLDYGGGYNSNSNWIVPQSCPPIGTRDTFNCFPVHTNNQYESNHTTNEQIQSSNTFNSNDNHLTNNLHQNLNFATNLNPNLHSNFGYNLNNVSSRPISNNNTNEYNHLNEIPSPSPALLNSPNNQLNHHHHSINYHYSNPLNNGQNYLNPTNTNSPVIGSNQPFLSNNYTKLGTDRLNTLQGCYVPPRVRRRNPTCTECVFCKNNGQPPSVYKGHILKDPEGVIQCPQLRSYSCPICKNGGGDRAHTLRYCPWNKPTFWQRQTRIQQNDLKKNEKN